MRAINITANAVSRGAADQHVRKIMLAASESRETYSSRDSIRAHLHPRTIVVFVRDHRGERPRLDAVAGRKRRSAVKELAAIFPGQRAATLRDLFERGDDDAAVNQRLSTEQARLARSFVVPGAPDKIEGCSDAADAIS